MNKEKVQILLSTYNGERFLPTQLDSLLEQDYPNLDILIRDDGSTDGTISLLQEYADHHPNITYIKGENLGAMGSFFALIQEADLSADYFAFCDQDDYWKKEKIRAAVELLSSHAPSNSQASIPMLYCGKPTLVDVELNQLPTSIAYKEKIPSFGNSLVENICYGCTTVINRELLQLAKQTIPKQAIMHDWWLYLLASCWGKVLYDTNSYLLYRQYEGNVVGTKGTYLSELNYRLKLLKKRKGQFSKQATEFYQFAEQINKKIQEPNLRLLRSFLQYKSSIRTRIVIMKNKEIHRQRKEDNAALKLSFLLGII